MRYMYSGVGVTRPGAARAAVNLLRGELLTATGGTTRVTCGYQAMMLAHNTGVHKTGVAEPDCEPVEG